MPKSRLRGKTGLWPRGAEGRGIALAQQEGMRRASARCCSALCLRSWAAVIASAAVLGCATSTVNRGADFYRQGRYIDADQLFEQAEPELAQLAVEERARYALYRGATYLALGDSSGAQRWLGDDSRLRGSALSALSGEEQQLLRASLRTLGGFPVWNAASNAAPMGAGLAAQSVRLSP